ncbi:hypothetical protein [Photobacterium sanguinicancri]|uniref:hypothetical protein n=1 Tax=Photobacterium sanguinicancri TaxID=875932 RepID=UPI0026E2B151|nr:hypothetical protein [Photobacterium sanguinicancri]MDO6497348.1 hypothetical protein [Photobacterium sanguinicancri]
MTEAQKIAAEAPSYVMTLIIEMLEGHYKDNEVLLGTVIDGDSEIQIQLKVTRDSEQFMDEI